MADLAAETVEVEKPYWRLDRDAAGRGGVVRPLLLAARPVWAVVRRVAPGAVAVVLACQLIGGVAVAVGLVVLNRLLALLIGGGNDSLTRAMPIALLLLAIGAARIAVDAIAALARASLAPRARRAAEERLFAATLAVDLACFDDADFYDRLKRARDRGILHLEGAIVALVDAFGAGVAAAGAIVALAVMQAALVPLILLALAPGLWGALAAARIQFAGMDRTVSLMRHADLYGELATRRAAAAEVRANAAGGWVIESFRRSAGRLQDHLVALARQEARLRALAAALSGLSLAIGFALLGLMIRDRWIDLAAAGAAIVAMRSAGESLRLVVANSHQLLEKALYIGDLEDFATAAEARARGGRGLRKPPPPQSITLDRVGFRYPGADAWALRDITASIRAGETIALAGENGSGKSTLAKLIAGLLPVSEGSIRWDGHDLATLCPEGVSEQVAMVLQEPVRWPDTARVNVEMGRPIARGDAGRLTAAALASGADAVIDRLPKGWDTLLSREFTGGQDLSAGQWQRFAIARGLYRDAPVVIWDEPTAPLDARAEAAAYESLRRLARGRTVLLITHRLSSIRAVDRILFLKAGRVVEQGSHAELMAIGGDYARLFELQEALNRVSAL